MPAATSAARSLLFVAALAFLTIVSSTTAHAEDSQSLSARIAELEETLAQEDADEDQALVFEEMKYLVGFFWQEGRGLQSQAGVPDERGSEDAWILQPIAYFRFRTGKRMRHEISVPVDIVSAASTDALDIVSQASKGTQAFEINSTSTFLVSDAVDLSFKLAAHAEENFRSFRAGTNIAVKLFEENTIFGLSAMLIADGFDPITPAGRDPGFAGRTTLGVDATYSQVLSPTTLFDLTYGVSDQLGTLQTPYNSVIVRREPTEDDPRTFYRTAEVFPNNRFRSAAGARLAQHIPQTATTIKLSYRFYFDQESATAHTTELNLFQYIVPLLYVNPHGRLHHQTAPSFWVPELVDPIDPKEFHTSDSDLEAFVSREVGLRVVLLRDRAPASFRDSDSFEAGYTRYQRDNGLHVDYASLGYSRTF